MSWSGEFHMELSCKDCGGRIFHGWTENGRRITLDADSQERWIGVSNPTTDKMRLVATYQKHLCPIIPVKRPIGGQWAGWKGTDRPQARHRSLFAGAALHGPGPATSS
jgi:hypothetical protein